MMIKLYVQNLEREYEKIKPFPIGLDLHTKGWRIILEDMFNGV